MTHVPVPDFANAEEVNFVLITRGKNDLAEYGMHYTEKPVKGTPPGQVAKGLVRGNIELKPGNGQAEHKLPELSVKVKKGVNLYVIGLESKTQTRFGPTSAPIQILPPEYSNDFLKDVGLIYVDLAGTEQFVAAADIPANYAAIPASAMLTFTLDRAKLEDAWNVGVTSAGHPDYAIKVPFFLNLYDTVSGLPVWAYGEHDGPKEMLAEKPASAGSGKPGLTTHGGIHPGKPTQFFY